MKISRKNVRHSLVDSTLQYIKIPAMRFLNALVFVNDSTKHSLCEEVWRRNSGAHAAEIVAIFANTIA